MTQLNLIPQPPSFCQYANGPCDQSFESTKNTQAFFFYSSQQELISNTLEEVVRKLRKANPDFLVGSWRDLAVQGRMIFCEICKAQRFTGVAVADVTSLNFNVMFEIGYALGLGVPVIPIRDTSFSPDHREFQELGLLDTFGFVDFVGSDELAEKLSGTIQNTEFPFSKTVKRNLETPIFIVKAPLGTDGQTKLMSVIKKSGLRFRTFDAKETSRLSIQDAYREVMSSTGVITHLLADVRRGSLVHNARCALIAGLALASGQQVLMLQEGKEPRPIDYRDVIQSYSDPNQVQGILTPFIADLWGAIQSKRFVPITLPLKALEKLDLGDVAAENEINALKSYFFPTSQYNEARRGHARLLVGRKGTGKTAVFYGIRNAFWTSQDHLVLDLKPEGHQFTKLREAVLEPLSRGMQEHVLSAFWTYLLLMEIANRIIVNDQRFSSRNSARSELYQEIKELYSADPTVEEGDFSERLLTLVQRISERAELASLTASSQLTSLIYERDINVLSRKLAEYLRNKEGVWVLVDNLDKGWPVNGTEPQDILILRSLLEATRKLQRTFSKDKVTFHTVVFIRNDIYEHLLVNTSDKGKDTAVLLEWNDREALCEIVRRRLIVSLEKDASFEELWSAFFAPHVSGQESFSYILSRTLMRPRDLLRYLRACINVAVNRGREKVLDIDILQAEKTYSEDQLQEVSFELHDIAPEYSEIVYLFIGSPSQFTKEELSTRMQSCGLPPSDADKVSELLLWFGFVGVLGGDGEEHYAYQYQYGVKRMLKGFSNNPTLIIHPAYRSALGCTEN